MVALFGGVLFGGGLVGLWNQPPTPWGIHFQDPCPELAKFSLLRRHQFFLQKKFLTNVNTIQKQEIFEDLSLRDEFFFLEVSK